MSVGKRAYRKDRASTRQRTPQQMSQGLKPFTQREQPSAIIQRVRRDPSSLTLRDVLHVRDTLGNRAVEGLVSKAKHSGSLGNLRPVAQMKPADTATHTGSNSFYTHLANLVLGVAGPMAVQILTMAGVHDASQLTNILFWARHPDMMGEKIKPGQKELAQDWLRIRDQIVKPVLAGAEQGGATTDGPQPGRSATGGAATQDPANVIPTPSTSDRPTVPTGPAEPTPTGPADLRDRGLATFVATLNNPAASAIAHDMAELEQKAREVDRESTEEKGRGRDELVAGIAQLRQKIAQLDSAGLDPVTLAELKRRLYRAINDVAPYYSQYRNIDLLEGKEQAQQLGTSTSVSTRTCNITSLSMALESLGKSANDYDGSKRDEIAAAARVFRSEVSSATLKVSGGSEAWGAMAGLRLSDFMELAAIAEVLSSGSASSAAVTAAAVEAWGKILSIYFLGALAKRFGASTTVKGFTLDPNKSKKEQAKDVSTLASFGRKHRGAVEKLVDARNKMEAASGKQRETLQKDYEKKLKALSGAMSGVGIEDSIGLASYQAAVTSQIGAELDRGAAVVVLLSGHYVRLQAIHDDHVIVDDPGQQARANRKVTWAEARAMGYFRQRLVIEG